MVLTVFPVFRFEAMSFYGQPNKAFERVLDVTPECTGCELERPTKKSLAQEIFIVNTLLHAFRNKILSV